VDDFQLKALTSAGVPAAIDMAKQYRLLGEPGVAESICRDVLLVDGKNADARVTLLLALTDQFARGIGTSFDDALDLARSCPDPYEAAYYTGIVYERRGKAHHRSGKPGSGEVAYEWLRKAMERFAEAERLRPAGNDNAILRWNSCVRRLRASGDLRPGQAGDEIAPQLGE
jgi:hypothetical protein